MLTIFASLNFGEITTRNTFSVDTLSYKTISANKENADKKWLLVDADGQTLGRIASEVAKLLRGKHKPNFTPHADCGDYVVVINAEKITLSGKKWDQKTLQLLSRSQFKVQGEL